MVFGGCIMASSPLLAVFMLRDLGFPAWQYGLCLGLPAVAGVVGSMLVKPLTRRLGDRAVLLTFGVARSLWLWLVPLATPGTPGLVLIIVADSLLLLCAGAFNPTFATYRMNATDDSVMARLVLAWSISNKCVQPLFIAAAGALAALTDARTALVVLSVLLLSSAALLPWRTDAFDLVRKHGVLAPTSTSPSGTASGLVGATGTRDRRCRLHDPGKAASSSPSRHPGPDLLRVASDAPTPAGSP